jgi:putative tryptophan/tyrosine transport system substrate-binding protein
MRRREFIALLGVTASPLGARAQQSKTFPRIGILFANKGGLAHALFASLAARGYVDGKTAHLLARDAEGRLEQLPQLARELVGLRVEVIIAVAAAATLAARNATTTIPIVMAHAGDPIGSGLIESLSHPGGNVTGTTSFAPEIVAKSIELLRELVPHASRESRPSSLRPGSISSSREGPRPRSRRRTRPRASRS